MVTLNDLSLNKDEYIDAHSLRGIDTSIIDNTVELNQKRKVYIKELISLQSNKKKTAKDRDKEIGVLIKERIKDTKEALQKINKNIDDNISSISNLVSLKSRIKEPYVIYDSLKYHKSSIDEFNSRYKSNKGRFTDVDIVRGSKVSGTGFYYLKDKAALLQLSLLNISIQYIRRYGFKYIYPPMCLNEDATKGTGFIDQTNRDDIYRIEKDDLYLVGTSEVPLISMYMNEYISTISPLRYVGYSTCYRREAGSYGSDTKGILRVHQFDKVEMVSYTSLDNSYEEHCNLINYSVGLLEYLKLPYRIVEIPVNDLGSSAYRKIDCEVWIPSQNKYREVASISNCLTFQSDRLNIKSKEGRVATLNGTLCAMPRIIVAIFELYSEEELSNILNHNNSIDFSVIKSPYINNLNDAFDIKIR